MKIPHFAALVAFALVSPAAAADIAAYPDAPEIAPPVTHIEKYAPVLEQSRGIPIDPDKGYGLLDLGQGAWFATEGVYQAMFLKTDDGLILADAPPNIGPKLLAMAEEISPGAPITHLIYSHAHIDHIGFAGAIVEAFPDVEIVAHEETLEKLKRAADPNRPLPATAFGGEDQIFQLAAGGQSLALRYNGPNHQEGNIEIWHAESRTLMLIDVVFPGWMMWSRLALAEDIPGTFRQIRDLNERYEFETLIAGHVGRPGTRKDVELQIEFMADLHNAAGAALGSVTPGEGMEPADLNNPWAVFDNYIDRVVVQCVNALIPKWQDQMSGFDVFIYDQCRAMEQSIRVDGSSL